MPKRCIHDFVKLVIETWIVLTSQALKKQCELPQRKLPSTAYTENPLTRKGDNHTHRYEHLTIPNFRVTV